VRDKVRSLNAHFSGFYSAQSSFLKSDYMAWCDKMRA